MEERALSGDIIEATDSDPEETAELLRKFETGKLWRKIFEVKDNPNDTRSMLQYLEALRKAGLDIGKGGAEFGFRMPLPEREGVYRSLLIFRRRIGSALATVPEKPNKDRNSGRGRNFRKRK